MTPAVKRIQVIDSHTGGEPTRIVIGGAPDLGSGSLAERLRTFCEKHDDFRRAVVNEPRGSDVLVGALLCEPVDATCAAGVIFFNNVGALGMCGHGTIGLVATLRHLGRIGAGVHRIETPVGVVAATFHDDGRVTVENVPSFRKACAITVEVPGLGAITGDVAWAGNWFFLVENHGQSLGLANVARLTDIASRIRQAVNADGFPEVDHIELFGPPENPTNNSRSFVLCPGGAYDRSPCGTGTSAKLACLFADGKLAPGVTWRQESVVGSVFEGSVAIRDGEIIPSITGRAFVNAESVLLLDEADPFCWGFPAKS